MISNKKAKLVSIAFFIIISFSSSMVTTSYNNNNNHGISDKLTTVQTRSIKWTVTLSYSIEHLSTGVYFDVSSSLTFFQNITFAPDTEPSLYYSIYNSTKNFIYSPTTPQLTFPNITIIANETIHPGLATNLDSAMIPRTDNYTINVGIEFIDMPFSNSFSAVVTGNSVSINFKNKKTTYSGYYDNTNSVSTSNSHNISSNSLNNSLSTVTITKSSFLPMNFTWYLIGFVPLIIFSKRRKKTVK